MECAFSRPGFMKTGVGGGETFLSGILSIRQVIVFCQNHLVTTSE